MSVPLARLGELIHLASDPRLRLERFTAALSGSPELASEVTQIAGSKLYGPRTRRWNLERAVLILGAHALGEIAANLVISRQLLHLEIGPLQGRTLWRHCLEIAVGAKLIARRLEIPFEREAYLAGLLHDLGVWTMYETHGGDYAELVGCSMDSGRPLEELEHEHFGETHARHLGMVAQTWGMPDWILQVVAGLPGAQPREPASRKIAQVIQASHQLVLPRRKLWSDRVPTRAPDPPTAPLERSVHLRADLPRAVLEQADQIDAAVSRG